MLFFQGKPVAISSQDIEYFSDDYHKTMLAVQTMRYGRLLKLEEKHLKELLEAIAPCEDYNLLGWKKLYVEIQNEQLNNVMRSNLEKEREITDTNLQSQVQEMNLTIEKMYNCMESIADRLEKMVGELIYFKSESLSFDSEEEQCLEELESVIKKCRHHFNRVNAPTLPPNFRLRQRGENLKENALAIPTLKRSESYLPRWRHKLKTMKINTEKNQGQVQFQMKINELKRAKSKKIVYVPKPELSKASEQDQKEQFEESKQSEKDQKQQFEQNLTNNAKKNFAAFISYLEKNNDESSGESDDKENRLIPNENLRI